MNKLKNVLTRVTASTSALTGIFGAFLFGLPLPVFAGDFACNEESFLPCFIQEIQHALGVRPDQDTNISGYINTRVQWGLTALFVIVFIVAIIYSGLAAIKFMSSQGESGKLEESKAAVKAILMGFAAMIVAIIGIFVVVWFLGGTPQFNEEFEEFNES